jgi:hypothetical protein
MGFMKSDDMCWLMLVIAAFVLGLAVQRIKRLTILFDRLSGYRDTEIDQNP